MSSPTESVHLRITLNRRARSLTLLRPVFDLETNKGRYPALGLESLDLVRLISAVLDVIITEMGGFQRGATYEQILDSVTAQLRKVQPGLEPTCVDRITSFLVDALTNEKACDAFRLQYQHEAPDGHLVWSPLVLKLVSLRRLVGYLSEKNRRNSGTAAIWIKREFDFSKPPFPGRLGQLQCILQERLPAWSTTLPLAGLGLFISFT